jgi:hypothetical protein
MRAGVFLGSFYGAKLPRITNTGSPVSEKNSSRKPPFIRPHAYPAQGRIEGSILRPSRRRRRG